jgi:hypothetical protein
MSTARTDESLVTPIVLGLVVMLLGGLLGLLIATPGLRNQWRYSRTLPSRARGSKRAR